MRLLNTKTLELKQFPANKVPPYLILSHRWQADETTLQHFEARKHTAGASCPPSIYKIQQFCRQALKARFDWVWVDACCIDKTSSAELTESINSMWRWYQQAEQCYVYLNDIEIGLPAWLDRPVDQSSYSHRICDTLSREAVEVISTELAGSDWFRRGWTLQELLAPRRVLFFDPAWNFVCERDEPAIREEVSKITHIRSKYFMAPPLIKEAPVAERMSWMIDRRTSLAEDMAYCLLGLFDVHMPLLYGEDENAFYRLQLEIIAKYDDESIFAWQDRKSTIPRAAGMLATEPSSFAWIVEEDASFEQKQWIDRGPFRMTNKGIEFEVFDSVSDRKLVERFKIPLNCWTTNRGWVCLEICRLRTGAHCRADSSSLTFIKRITLDPDYPDEFRKRFNVYVRQFGISQLDRLDSAA